MIRSVQPGHHRRWHERADSAAKWISVILLSLIFLHMEGKL